MVKPTSHSTPTHEGTVALEIMPDGSVAGFGGAVRQVEVAEFVVLPLDSSVARLHEVLEAWLAAMHNCEGHPRQACLRGRLSMDFGPKEFSKYLHHVVLDEAIIVSVALMEEVCVTQ